MEFKLGEQLFYSKKKEIIKVQKIYKKLTMIKKFLFFFLLTFYNALEF